jgi:tetratricopeptide (TPR) repeat protein
MAALEDYTEAIEIAPHKSKNYLCRGALHASMGNLDKAILDFSKVIELHPDAPDGYFLRGEMYLEVQDYASASKDFEVVVDTTSEKSEVVYTIAARFASSRNVDETCRWLQKALEKEPQLVDRINHDEAFDSIREANPFTQLMNKFTSNNE